MTRTVPAILAGCLLFAACGGSDGDTDTTTTIELDDTTPVATDPPDTVAAPATTTTVPLVVEGATVVVANGNIVGGSAGRMTDALGLEGFTTGPAVNGTEKIDDSIVYYSDADGAQVVADSVATVLGGIDTEPLPETIPTESGTLEGADVLLLLGNNQADKTLAELGGETATEAETETEEAAEQIENSGSIVVVANGSGVGGSAGRMTERLEAAGFTVGEPTNSTAQATESVIYFGSAEAEADANILATAMGGLTVLELPEDVPTDAGSLDGDILLVLGVNEADKTLAELAG